MKTRKLLSLVLALAMSLMAMGVTAFAEGENVAEVNGTQYDTLTAAIDAANAGDTITLLSDVDATGYQYNEKSRLPISKSVTIDGGNNKITVQGRGFGVGEGAASKVNVTFKNVTILNAATSNAVCINTRGNIDTLTLDNVTLSTPNGGQYDQPLTIGGKQADTATININNSKITAKDYYAIIVWNPVNMNLTNTDVEGYACMYFKGETSTTAGSAGSTVTVNGGKFTSVNPHSGTSNAFGMLVFEDPNIAKTTDVTFTNANLNVTNSGDQYQALALFKYVGTYENGDYKFSKGNVKLDVGNVVTLNGADAYFSVFDNKMYESSESTFTITGGTYNVDPSEYVADGYAAVKTAENVYQVGKLTKNELAETAAATDYEATYVATKTIVDESSNQTLAENKTTTVNVKAVDNEITTNLNSAAFDRESIVNDVVAAIAEDTLGINFELVRGDNNTTVENNAITYEVHPEAKIYVGNTQVGSEPLTNDKLAAGASFDITLPVPNELVVNGKVKVTHKSTGYADEIGIYPVVNGNVTVTGVTHFSDFTLTKPAANGEVIVSEFDSYKGNDGYWNLRAISQISGVNNSEIESFGTWFIPKNITEGFAQETEKGEVSYIAGLSADNKFKADLLNIPGEKGDTLLTVVSFVKINGIDEALTNYRTTTASANANRTSR